MKTIFVTIFLCGAAVANSCQDRGDCTNVAEGSLAVAGNVGLKGKPVYAIDGKTENSVECYNSAVPNRGNNRLKIFLRGSEIGVKYPVKSVTVYAYDKTINFAKVFVDGFMCGQIRGTGKEGKYEISCNNVKAGTVMIEQVHSSLRLCEVQVWVSNDQLPEVGAFMNIAEGMTATQSDTRSKYGPELAVDGNMNKWHSGGVCSIISSSRNHKWWSVNLGAERTISSVVIHSSMELPHYINSASVFVRNGEDGPATFCGVVEFHPGNPPVYMLSCNGAKGDRIEVVGRPERQLILCEVAVYIEGRLCKS